VGVLPNFFPNALRIVPSLMLLGQLKDYSFFFNILLASMRKAQ
jgi:hypothetical protein